MAFFLNNIGYIIIGFLALVVMGSSRSEDDAAAAAAEYAAFEESAWYNSSVNPNGPNYTGI